MKHIKQSQSFIEIYFNGILILEIIDMEFGIEAYDNLNHAYIPVISLWLSDVYEELKSYENTLLAQLTS